MSGRYVGVARVSTEEQGASGLSLDAQTERIEAACRERGWTLVRVEREVASGATKLDRRPALERAMAECDSGHASGIVVTKTDRLCRSLVSWAAIVERAQRGSWNLVVLDQGFDLDTPNGRAMAGMLAVFAQFEREMISERTRAALRKLPRERRNGRPVFDESVRQRAQQLRAKGLTLRAIADRLEAEGVHPVRGGRALHPTTVAKLLDPLG